MSIRSSLHSAEIRRSIYDFSFALAGCDTIGKESRVHRLAWRVFRDVHGKRGHCIASAPEHGEATGDVNQFRRTAGSVSDAASKRSVQIRSNGGPPARIILIGPRA